MPFDAGRVKALLFDVDGTLSDSDELWTEWMERWLRPIRFSLPQHDPRPAARRLVMGLESPGNALYHLLDQVGLDAAAVNLLRWSQSLQRNPRTVFRVQDGMPALIERLSVGYRLAIVSARDEASTLSFLDAFALRPFFRCIATSQTCRYTKPYPDPLLWAAAQLGVQPGECVMIGDTTVDIHAGKAAGAQTVGVLCGFGTEAELKRAGADVILPATEDLGSILAIPH
jgi:N-acetyl-D-muramate 6-phosphate phosphatase